jgi:hypothetical protein
VSAFGAIVHRFERAAHRVGASPGLAAIITAWFITALGLVISWVSWAWSNTFAGVAVVGLTAFAALLSYLATARHGQPRRTHHEPPADSTADSQVGEPDQREPEDDTNGPHRTADLATHQAEALQPHRTETHTAPSAVDLVNEAVLASALEIWEYQMLDPDEVLERVRDAIKHPALLNENEALAALKKSAAIHVEWSQKIKQQRYKFFRDFRSDGRQTRLGARNPEFRRVAEIIAPIKAIMPSKQEYLMAIRNLPTGSAADVFRTGYHRHTKDDMWTRQYLILLSELGDDETLIPLLVHRLKDPSIIGTDGEEVTRAIARASLGADSYAAWIQEISPD